MGPETQINLGSRFAGRKLDPFLFFCGQAFISLGNLCILARFPVVTSRGLGGLLFVLMMLTAQAANHKRVLVLYSFGRGFWPIGVVAGAFQTELAREFQQPIEFHEAVLESPRFATSNSEDVVVSYLQTLFAGGSPDLVVPCGGPAVRFALRQRFRLFPSVPLLLAAAERRHLNGFTLDTNTTAVTASFDFPGVIENIQHVWPGTTNVVVVLGNSSLETFWKTEMEREFEPFTNHLAFAWWNEFTLADMQERARGLPAHSVIFYGSMFVDASGVPYEHDRALTALRATANAPIVGMFEEDLGLGIVGGPLLGLHQMGRETARVAGRILRGESSGNINTPTIKPQKPVYDWRELKRWGISERQLPAGSEVRFRTPTFAEQYRWKVFGIIGLCVVEAVLIVALAYQLRRRRQTERSLRESQERMNLATGAANLGIWDWDLVEDKLWAAGPIAARIGLKAPDLSYAAYLLQSVHPADRDTVRRALAKAMQGDGHFESVHRTARSDGQMRWISLRGRVEFDNQHKPLRMRGVSLDITARKQAEASARESEQRFLLMANAAPVLLWTSGTDKGCTFFNQTWLEFTGRSLEQELGTGWAEGVHPDDRAGCLKTYSEAFEAREPFTIEYRLRRRDGKYRWVLDHGVPRYDGEHVFLGYIGSCVDMTERREAETETQQTRQQLAHMTRVSTMGELAGSLAHELNQPLTAILSNAQAAQRFLSTEPADLKEVREILGDIIEEDRRAGEIIVRMRSMLRKGQAEMLPVDLNLIIGEVLGMLRSELVVRKVTAKTELARELPLVVGDRIQLQQVLLNLIVNACEAMATNSQHTHRLTLKTKLVGADLVEAEVMDNGPGFAPGVLERMGEPFHTTKPNGLGLGLAICRSILTAHGGRLSLTNLSDNGASARLTMPAYAKEML